MNKILINLKKRKRELLFIFSLFFRLIAVAQEISLPPNYTIDNQQDDIIDSSKIVLDGYQEEVVLHQAELKSTFGVSLVAQGPFQASANVDLIASVTHNPSDKIEKVELYKINSQKELELCKKLDEQGNLQPYILTEEPYEFLQENLPAGKYEYEVRAYDEGNNMRTARVSFEVLLSNYYKRGWGNDDQYLSSLIALEGEKGIFLDGIKDFHTVYPKEYPWFLRTASALNEPCFHIRCDTNTPDNSQKIKYDIPVNSMPEQSGHVTGGEPPMVVFGSEGGGDPLYTRQWYSFSVLGVQKKDANSDDDIQIEVYRKEDFKDSRENVSPIAVLKASIPKPNSQNWKKYNDDFFICDLPKPKTGTGEEIDFSTQLRCSEQSPANIIVMNKADNNDYYYRISFKGYTDNQYSNNNHYGKFLGMAMDSLKKEVCYNLCYSLDFDQQLPWGAKVLEPPYFQAIPLLPAYQGKSLNELIHHPQMVKDTLPAPEKMKLALNSLGKDTSSELKLHSTLDKLAQDLDKNPIAIANYVQNEIELTDAIEDISKISEGITPKNVRRDALGTYLEGQGSPWEQCALLIYLLRKAGVACGYVIPEKGKTLMLDEQLSCMLKMQLRGYNGGTEKPNLELIAVNYPWVVAFIDGKWVHLFPWIKDTEVIEGKNLWNYFPQDYQTPREWAIKYLLNDPSIRLLSKGDSLETLLSLYAKKQLASFGLSLDDVGVEYRDRKHYYVDWEDFPKPWKTPLISEKNVAQNLDAQQNQDNPEIKKALENIFDTISIQVFSDRNGNQRHDNGEPILETGPMRLADLHDRRRLLYHQLVPAEKGKYQMILAMEPYDLRDENLEKNSPEKFNQGKSPEEQAKVLRGAQEISTKLQTTNGTDNDGPLVFKMNFCIDNQKIENLRSLYKGDMASLCLNYGRVSQRMETFEAKKYWDYQKQVRDNPTVKIDPTRNIGQLLHLMGQSYYFNCYQFDKFAQKICKEVNPSQFSWGLASLVPSYNKDGTIITTTHNGVEDLALSYPRVDMISAAYEYATHLDKENYLKLDDLKMQPLSVVNGSAEEHRTINQFFGIEDAVSTVKLLDIAQGWTPETGVASHPGEGVYLITQENKKDIYAKESTSMDQMEAYATILSVNTQFLEIHKLRGGDLIWKNGKMAMEII